MENFEEKREVAARIEENIEYMRDSLGIGKSFDVIHLDLFYAERKMAIFFLDGFIKDDIFTQIMILLSRLEAHELEERPLDRLLKTYIPYVELEATDDLKKSVDSVLAGPTVLFVDGEKKAIIIDARTYPARGPEEPDIERVVRGSRDGYVETLVFNTALTRRRIRDRSLRMEFLQVGRRSKTDIVICYLEDIADPKQVEDVKNSISKIDTDGLPMAEKTIEEFISGRHWNPYPIIRYTER